MKRISKAKVIDLEISVMFMSKFSVKFFFCYISDRFNLFLFHLFYLIF